MRAIRWAGLAVLVLAGVVPPAQAQKGRPVPSPLVEGNTEFAARLYQRLAEAEKGNLFYSPYSISSALAMTYAGARGNTAAEMKDVLRFHLPDEQLHAEFGRLIDQLQKGPRKQPFQLSVANRLWGQKDYGFLPAFTKLAADQYGAGLEEVDFVRSSEPARQRINAWVEEQTRGKIKDLIPAGVVNDMTRLVLANAIYFKAGWQSPFDPKQTAPGEFTRADGKKVSVPLMRQHWKTDFADLGDFTMVRLPYQQHRQAMLVLLPKKPDGLTALEKRLTAENLTAWTGKLRDHLVDLRLPKFKVTAEFQLNNVLKQMGMKDAFEPGKADFSGLATREKLFISAVLHKAFVDVNEIGTEAAAATGVVVGTLSLPTPATFHADRPFLFLIQDQASGTVLFVGRVADPS